MHGRRGVMPHGKGCLECRILRVLVPSMVLDRGAVMSTFFAFCFRLGKHHRENLVGSLVSPFELYSIKFRRPLLCSLSLRCRMRSPSGSTASSDFINLLKPIQPMVMMTTT